MAKKKTLTEVEQLKKELDLLGTENLDMARGVRDLRRQVRTSLTRAKRLVESLQEFDAELTEVIDIYGGSIPRSMQKGK